MSLYERSQDLVLRTLQKYGASLTHRKLISQVDVVTQVGTTVEQDRSVVGLVLPVTSASFYLFEDADDEASIVKHGRIVLIAAKNLVEVPVVGDYMIFHGQTWKVSGRRVVQPGDIPLLYRLGVRS